jgi:hypothetical protein
VQHTPYFAPPCRSRAGQSGKVHKPVREHSIPRHTDTRDPHARIRPISAPLLFRWISRLQSPSEEVATEYTGHWLGSMGPAGNDRLEFPQNHCGVDHRCRPTRWRVEGLIRDPVDAGESVTELIDERRDRS